MCQAEVFPVVYLNGAKMALGWPTGRNGLCMRDAQKWFGFRGEQILGGFSLPSMLLAKLVPSPAKPGDLCGRWKLMVVGGQGRWLWGVGSAAGDAASLPLQPAPPSLCPQWPGVCLGLYSGL